MVLLIAVIACFTLRLMRYQITDGASYRADANKTDVESVPITAPRGEILDRYGRVLATNTVGYSVILEKAAFPQDDKTKNETILELTNILSKNNVTWGDTLPISRTRPYSFNANSDKDITALRTLLKLDEKAKLSADQAMDMLNKRYKINPNFSKDEMRTIIGVRYEMEIRGFSYTNYFDLADNVTLDIINQISERSIPGITITEQYSRTYPDGSVAPQVIGTVGPIDADEYKQMKKDKNSTYQLSDIIGKNGIESTMESELRGKSGKEQIEFNNSGNLTGKSVLSQYQPGNNVELTIDSDLQHVIEQELPQAIANVVAGSHGDPAQGAICNSGAAVVINVKTGEVLAMVSYPSYDNNTYRSNYAQISNTPGNPLINRPISGTYRPGSTYKPCVATSGLMNGVITGTSTIDCNGSFTKYSGLGYNGHDDGSWGPLSVVEALGYSSNVFFDTVGDRLNLTNKHLLETTAKSLGLGQKTGIELTSEHAGSISGPTYAASAGLNWNPADGVQSAIGQMYNQYTLLQLADYIGGVVNGGTRYQAHIVKSVKSYDNSKTISEPQPKVVSGDFKIPDNVVNLVKQGMLKVTEETGTASQTFANYPLKIGGKTGTSQVPKDGLNYHNGLFVSFAPFNDPQIAVAVVLEYAYWGADTAPIAKTVYDYMFLDNPNNANVTAPSPYEQLLH